MSLDIFIGVFIDVYIDILIDILLPAPLGGHRRPPAIFWHARFAFCGRAFEHGIFRIVKQLYWLAGLRQTMVKGVAKECKASMPKSDVWTAVSCQRGRK